MGCDIGELRRGKKQPRMSRDDWVLRREATVLELGRGRRGNKTWTGASQRYAKDGTERKLRLIYNDQKSMILITEGYPCVI